jgi:hypothetical protein
VTVAAQYFRTYAGSAPVFYFTGPGGGLVVSGWTVEMHFRRASAADADPPALVKSGAAVTFPNGGLDVQVALTKADTGTTLGPGLWLFVLWRVDAGAEDVLAEGEVYIAATS